MLRFFELDPIYADRFDKVWMWNDWPDKGAVGDIGIDLVARDRATGEHVAIQCKFYLPEHTLAKADIDAFSGEGYADDVLGLLAKLTPAPVVKIVRLTTTLHATIPRAGWSALTIACMKSCPAWA